MKEILDKLETIEVRLRRIETSIGDLGSSSVYNFTTLDKLIKEKIDQIKDEVIKEIKKGR